MEENGTAKIRYVLGNFDVEKITIIYSICSFVRCNHGWLVHYSFSHADYHLYIYHTQKIYTSTHTHAHACIHLLQLAFVNVHRGLKISRQASLHVHIVCCMIDTIHEINSHTHTLLTATQNTNTYPLSHIYTIQAHKHTYTNWHTKYNSIARLKITFFKFIQLYLN